MSPRRWSRRRWPLAGLVSVLMLLLWGEGSGWPLLRAPVQRLLSDGIGLPTSLGGDFHMRLLWNPGLRVQQVRVDAAPGHGDGPVLDAEDVELRWSWPALWRWQHGAPLALRLLSARRLHANLQRDAQGRANWQGSGNAMTAWPRVGWLVIEQGQVQIDDAVADTKLDVRIHGAERDDAAPMAGTGYGVSARGRYEGLPLDMRAQSGALLPLLRDDEAGPSATTVPLTIEGTVGRARLRFEGSGAALFGAPRLQGEMRLQARSLAAVGDVLGMALPRTRPFDLRGELRHAHGVWQMREVLATVGDSRLGGSFRYDTRTSPPKLTGRLTGPRLWLSDLGPAVGVTASAADQAAAPRRVLPEQPLELPKLGRMDADVQVQIDELGFRTAQLRPMQGLRAHLTLSDAVLRLDGMQARVGGGRFWGSTQLDGRNDAALWAADLRFAEVEVAQWIRAVRKSDVAAAARDGAPASYLSGELTGAVRVQGQGRSTAQILGSLDGKADLRLRGGQVSHLVTEIAGLDLAQALGVAVRGDDPLPLNCARLDLEIRNGVAHTRTAVLDNRDSTVRLEGQVNLRDETLALRSTVKPKDFSPMAFRAPFDIGGTLAEPKVSIEPGGLAARAAASVALGVIATPVAALLPWIDFSSKPEESACASVAAAAPAASAASAR